MTRPYRKIKSMLAVNRKRIKTNKMYPGTRQRWKGLNYGIGAKAMKTSRSGSSDLFRTFRRIFIFYAVLPPKRFGVCRQCCDGESSCFTTTKKKKKIPN